MNNPIIDAVTRILSEGKDIAKLSAELSLQKNKKVTIFLKDGSSQTLEPESDHNQFMK